jgi:hypothetical protein
MEWITASVAVAFFIWWTWFMHRAGRKYGQLEGFADGLAAHKEVQSAREQRQRDEYTAYLRQQEEKNREKRDGTER